MSGQDWQQQGWGAPPPPPPPGPGGQPGIAGPGAGGSPTPWVLALVVLLVVSVVLSFAVDSKDGGGGGGDVALPGDFEGIGDIGDIGDFGDLGGIGDSAGLGDDGPDTGDFGDIGGDTGGDTAIGGGGASGGSTGGTSGGATGGSGGSGGSSGSGSGSGGSTPSPPPDPTAEAFAAVRPGDCLKNWHTGSAWSSTTPVKATCDTNDGIMWVSSVKNSSSACPSGPGQSYLAYQSNGQTTALCLTRQFKVGFCFLGKQEGSGSGAKITDANLLSLVECTAAKVPQPWNQIMHITGVYRAPAQVTYESCARVAGDQTYYWHWVVNDGKTLVCTMVYGS